jgi:Na+/H+-dicarboxylate symporter
MSVSNLQKKQQNRTDKLHHYQDRFFKSFAIVIYPVVVFSLVNVAATCREIKEKQGTTKVLRCIW